MRCKVFADPADTGNPKVIRKRLIGGQTASSDFRF
jgi:hypothetical protein